jgi:hypothetical protein
MEIRIAYRRRKNISKMRNVHLAARAHVSAASKTFSTISNSFVSTSPSTDPRNSMDVSIIRNVNFRRRNIIHTAVGTRATPKRDISKYNVKIARRRLLFSRARERDCRALHIACQIQIFPAQKSNYRPINARVANLLCKREFIV